MAERQPIIVVPILLLATLTFSGCVVGSEDGAAPSFDATPQAPDQTAYRFHTQAKAATYAWDFGDGHTSTQGPDVEHAYEYPNGVYKVQLTLTNGAAIPVTVTRDVPVGLAENQAPSLFLRADQRWVAPGDDVAFDASASTDPDGDPLTFSWDFNAPLEDAKQTDLENLGFQQYGNRSSGAAPDQSGGAETGCDGGCRTTASPGPVDEVLARVVGDPGFHGGTDSGPEPRNSDLDGRIPDSDPRQVFRFPSPAIYYVVVTAIDVKGTASAGFIRIQVTDTVAERVQRIEANDQSLAGTVPSPSGALDKSREHAFDLAYPARTTLWLNFTKDPEANPAGAQMGLLVCGQSIPETQCEGSTDHRLDPGPSGRTYAYESAADKTGSYKVIVQNKDHAAVKYTLVIESWFDLNPWVREESGLGEQGH